MLAAPIYGSQIVSARVRLVLGFMLSLLITPLLPPLPVFGGISLSTLLVTLQQVLIGVTLGFIFQVVVQVFVLAGQYIAMKMGLGFASLNDPTNGISVTIISQFYLMLTTLLFLSVNGHLQLIHILVDSFTLLPIGEASFSGEVFYNIVELGSWMFASALSIALPLLTALLVVNIAFGVMSRAAPQINIFAVGFPITLMFGLFLIWICLSNFFPLYQKFIEEGFDFTHNIIQL